MAAHIFIIRSKNLQLIFIAGMCRACAAEN